MFDPYSWALAFGLNRLVGKLLGTQGFGKDLREAAIQWSKSLPEDFQIAPLALFMGTDVKNTGITTARQALRLSLEQSRIPTRAIWEDALIEQFVETRERLQDEAVLRNRDFARDSQPFFVKDPTEVRPFLSNLAERFVEIYARDPTRQQREIYEVIRGIHTLQDESGKSFSERAALPSPPVRFLVSPKVRETRPLTQVSEKNFPRTNGANAINTLSEDLVHPSDNPSFDETINLIRWLESVSLFDLVNYTEWLEDMILKEARRIVVMSLESEGYQKSGEWFHNEVDRLQLNITPIPISGGHQLYIAIDRPSAPKTKTKSVTVRIGGIGRIQSVCIKMPQPEPCFSEIIAASLKAFLMGSYAAVELALVQKNDRLGGDLFSRLYNLITMRLQAAGKQRVLGHFWLILATESQILYFFDHDRLKSAIDHFKDVRRNGIRGRSPLELTLSILTDTFPFEKSLAIEAWRASSWLDLPWKNARYLDDAPIIHAAEMRLFASESYSAFVPCEFRRHFLVFACPTEARAELFPEVEALRNEIAYTFEAGLSSFSGYIATVSREIWQHQQGHSMANL